MIVCSSGFLMITTVEFCRSECTYTSPRRKYLRSNKSVCCTSRALPPKVRTHKEAVLKGRGGGLPEYEISF